MRPKASIPDAKTRTKVDVHMISAVVKLMLQRADDVALYRPKGSRQGVALYTHVLGSTVAELGVIGLQL